MATTFSYQHTPKNGTFIYVCHNAKGQFGYALRHEFLHAPHIKSFVALYAWGIKEPVFVGHFGHIVAHWQDCMDIIIHPSSFYYADHHQIPQSYLLRIPTDLIQLDAVHTVIRKSRWLLDSQVHIEKLSYPFLPILFYCTQIPGSSSIELIPLASYKVLISSFFVTIEHGQKSKDRHFDCLLTLTKETTNTKKQSLSEIS